MSNLLPGADFEEGLWSFTGNGASRTQVAPYKGAWHAQMTALYAAIGPIEWDAFVSSPALEWEAGVTYAFGARVALVSNTNDHNANLSFLAPDNSIVARLDSENFTPANDYFFWDIGEWTAPSDITGNVTFRTLAITGIVGGTTWWVDTTYGVLRSRPTTTPENGQAAAPLWERWPLDPEAGVLFPFTEGELEHGVIRKRNLIDAPDRTTMQEEPGPVHPRTWWRL